MVGLFPIIPTIKMMTGINRSQAQTGGGQDMNSIQKLVKQVLKTQGIHYIEMHPDDVKKYHVDLNGDSVNSLYQAKQLVKHDGVNHLYCVTKLGGFIYTCPVLFIHQSYHRYYLIPINVTDAARAGYPKILST